MKSSNIASPTRKVDTDDCESASVERVASRDCDTVSSPLNAADGQITKKSSSSISASSPPSLSDAASDPFDLIPRFIEEHRRCFSRALSELRGSGKSSCWSWFVIPTQPWVVNGVERGSYTNMRYCLRDARAGPQSLVGHSACAAYLRLPPTRDVHLRQNYIEVCDAISEKLQQGWTLLRLLGFLDDPKARASFKLFEKVTRGSPEFADVHSSVTRVMKLCKEAPES